MRIIGHYPSILDTAQTVFSYESRKISVLRHSVLPPDLGKVSRLWCMFSITQIDLSESSKKVDFVL